MCWKSQKKHGAFKDKLILNFFKNWLGQRKSNNQAASEIYPTPTLLPIVGKPPDWARITYIKALEDGSLAPLPSPEVAKHSRLAWVWKIVDGESSPDATRTGGRPIMAETEIWPSCGACKNHLTFMMQCNFDTMPNGVHRYGSGILRFFYCFHEDCVGMGGWKAFSPQHHFSLFNGLGNFRNTPERTHVIEPQYVSSTVKAIDIPHWPDREGLEFSENYIDVPALSGHKFAGWPYWIQGPERPNCPSCSAVMEPFIQLDNDWNSDFNFGGGVGHISQCKTHPDQFAFGWAC